MKPDRKAQMQAVIDAMQSEMMACARLERVAWFRNIYEEANKKLHPEPTMNPPNTAPKEGPFLGHFGYPWLQMAMWNEPSLKWVVADVQVGLYEGEWNDTYFENEMHAEKDLLGWLPVPSIPPTPTTTQP